MISFWLANSPVTLHVLIPLFHVAIPSCQQQRVMSRLTDYDLLTDQYLRGLSQANKRANREEPEIRRIRDRD
ncbi:hypothetical protein J6590_007995 [Homalodisca vitripennis]|nr:hypothetical protein J6590_007995 [Homalodisca vitripennis]